MLENYFFRSVSVLLLLFAILTAVNCTIQTMHFYRESSMNGKICTEENRIVQVSTISKIVCSEMCDESSACTGVFYNVETRGCTTCTEYTIVEEQVGTIFLSRRRTQYLDGRTFKIIAKEDNKFWHFNGGGGFKVVTSFAQPDDAFVRFVFEKQGDGSYKIKSVALPIYMYDGFDVTGSYAPYLNGRDNTDDDHMRYHVSMETQDYFRIQTKATGRYVRLDPDKYVSTRYNIKDDRSLFMLAEV